MQINVLQFLLYFGRYLVNNRAALFYFAKYPQKIAEAKNYKPKRQNCENGRNMKPQGHCMGLLCELTVTRPALVKRAVMLYDVYTIRKTRKTLDVQPLYMLFIMYT